MATPTILKLPGELRNMIYDHIASETKAITIREGSILPHPLAQTCRQLRQEFSSFQPGKHILKPARTTMQIRDFDFDQSVEALKRFVDATEFSFHIQVKVTKQLGREQWEKMWSWVHFSDSLSVSNGSVAARKVETSYTVRTKLQACNPQAACHALYVEVVPYILKGGVGRGQTSAGYEQIEKMRAALAGCSVVI